MFNANFPGTNKFGEPLHPNAPRGYGPAVL